MDMDMDMDVIFHIHGNPGNQGAFNVSRVSGRSALITVTSWTTRRHSRDDPREDVGKDVGVGVVECGLQGATLGQLQTTVVNHDMRCIALHTCTRKQAVMLL